MISLRLTRRTVRDLINLMGRVSTVGLGFAPREVLGDGVFGPIGSLNFTPHEMLLRISTGHPPQSPRPGADQVVGLSQLSQFSQ